MAINKPITVTAPVDITIPANATSIDKSLTLSSGDAVSLSIGGVFTISILSKTPAGAGPQTVQFRLSLNAGTPRPGADSRPITVVVNGNPTPVSSNPVEVSY